MIDEKFIFLAPILIIYGDLRYMLAALRGEVKPNRVTWFLWALAPLVAFSSQYIQGVGMPALTTFALGFVPLFIFIASFLNKKAYWKITTFDLICGALAVIGLVLWGITKTGNFAITFGILADGLAAVPTLVKSYNFPETENYHPFLFSGIGSVITLLAIKDWSFAHYAFPIYMLSLCIILFSLIRFKLGKNHLPI